MSWTVYNLVGPSITVRPFAVFYLLESVVGSHLCRRCQPLFVDRTIFRNDCGSLSVQSLHDDLVTSPLKTKRRVVMDLSFSCWASINNGIWKINYLDTAFELHLPSIDHLRNLIVDKAPGCYVLKKDFKRANTGNFRSTPKITSFSAATGTRYCTDFDTTCPLGLRSSAMICQRTTRAVIYIFTQEGFSADAYLHDFYDVEYPSVASAAFEWLQNLLNLYYLKKSRWESMRRWECETKIGFYQTSW